MGAGGGSSPPRGLLPAEPEAEGGDPVIDGRHPLVDPLGQVVVAEFPVGGHRVQEGGPFFHQPADLVVESVPFAGGGGAVREGAVAGIPEDRAPQLVQVVPHQGASSFPSGSRCSTLRSATSMPMSLGSSGG